MYTTPQPAPMERPASITHGAASVVVACVGLLLVTFASVSMMTWKPPNHNAADASSGITTALLIQIGWGLLSVILLMLGVVMTLRGRNGGRVLVWIIGGMTLVTLLGCGGLSVVAMTVGDESGKESFPPHWMFYLGITGSVIGAVAIVMALVYYGRRVTGQYLKPRIVQYPQPPYGQPRW